jgi:hypothetical protein
MLYAIHDESGRINQANKVFVEDFKSYEKLLGDLGQTYVRELRPGLLPPEYWFVNTATRRIKKRPQMRARPQARFVKVGTMAVVTGIPKGASVDVLAAGSTIWSIAALDGDELEFSMPDYPCTFRVIVRSWPYQDRVIDIEGVKA